MIETSSLRRKLLDLAITGRLGRSAECGVRSAECDGRVEVEKCREVSTTDGTDGRAASMKPPLPPGWKMVKLGDIGEVCMCKRILKEQTSDKGEIPFYKIGTFGKTPTAFIAKSLFDEYTRKYSYPRKGDILISAAGTIGRVVVFDGEPSYFQDSNIVWLSHDGSSVLNEYLYWYYQTSPWKITTGTTIPRLYNENILNAILPLPPLAEQKAIVKRLEELLALEREIAADSTAVEDLVMAAKRKVLELAVSGKLSAECEESAECRVRSAEWNDGRGERGEHGDKEPTDYTDCDAGRACRPATAADGRATSMKSPLPPSWKMVKLGDITRSIGTKQHQITTKEIMSSGFYPVVSQGQGLVDGYTDAAEKVIADVPLILFGDHTKNVKYIDFSFVVGADGTKLFAPLEGIDVKWLYYWTLNATHVIGNRGYGRHWSLLQKLDIPLPPLAEQRAIVAKVDELFSVLDAMKG